MIRLDTETKLITQALHKQSPMSGVLSPASPSNIALESEYTGSVEV